MQPHDAPPRHTFYGPPCDLWSAGMCGRGQAGGDRLPCTEAARCSMQGSPIPWESSFFTQTHCCRGVADELPNLQKSLSTMAA
jgi:hypothetical protein